MSLRWQRANEQIKILVLRRVYCSEKLVGSVSKKVRESARGL